MKIIVPVAFVLMCVAQWFVPGSMIVAHEDVLKTGHAYRFRTAPIDPSDPFRGKYVILDFESELLDYPTKDGSYDDEVFAAVVESADGFAVVKGLHETPPQEGDYFSAEVMFHSEGRIRLRFPFKRFYVEESKAREAERVYWENRTDTTQVAYAVVRIKNGKSVLEDVRINERSIIDIVREINAKPGAAE